MTTIEAKLDYETLLEKVRLSYCYMEGDNKIIRLTDLTEFGQTEFNNSVDGRALTARLHEYAVEQFKDEVRDQPDNRRKPTSIKRVSAWELVIDILPVVTARVAVFGEHEIICDYTLQGITQDVLNQWRGSSLRPSETVTEDDVAIWLDHIHAVAGDQAEVLIDWFAWIVQRANEKVRWAPLIHSKQGVGKDSMVAPIHQIFGAHNTVEIEAKTIDGSFNAYDRAKFVILNELENDTRYTTYNKIKPKISGTGSGMTQVNEKFKAPYWANNVSAWMVFTNHDDAMPLEEGDRRFHVIKAKHPVELEQRQAYYRRMWDFYRTQNGYEKVFAYLIRRDVTDFNPDQPPTPNQAKVEMQYEAMTEGGQWGLGLAQVGELRDRKVVCNREIEWLSKGRDIYRGLSSKKIRDGMEGAGYTKLGSHPLTGGRTPTEKTTFWVRDDAVRHLGDSFTARHREVMMAEMPSDVVRGLKISP
jgi:hypothetical protein